VNVSVTQVNQNTLSADEVGVDYQWIDCSDDSFISGEMNQIFIANNNGSFAVQITENGCIDTSSCFSVIGVGFNENNFNNNQISLYPNPTNGNVIVKLGELKEVSISVIDITGKVVKTLTVLNERQVNLRLDDLSNGLYYVKIQSSDKQKVVRLVKH
jgi:hypothetical protein